MNHLATHEGELGNLLVAASKHRSRWSAHRSYGVGARPCADRQVFDETRQIVAVSRLEAYLLPVVELLIVELACRVGIPEDFKHTVTFGVTDAHPHLGWLFGKAI